MNEKIIISLIFFLVHVTTFHHHAALGQTIETKTSDLLLISGEPTDSPTESPAPSPSPSETPTQSTHPSMTGVPTKTESSPPTVSNRPTDSPTESPAPSPSPSAVPTNFPSSTPSASPSEHPSITPTDGPSLHPSAAPSFAPSDYPSLFPVASPSSKPSVAPSFIPTDGPSVFPSESPSSKPSSSPSSAPSGSPSKIPSGRPSFVPSDGPSIYPSVAPSLSPSELPSDLPSLASITLSDLFPGIFLNRPSPTAPKDMDIELRSPPTSIPQTMSSESTTLSSQPIGHLIPLSGRIDLIKSSVPSSQPTNYDSAMIKPSYTEKLENDVPTSLSVVSSRKTVNSLFLEQINSPMDFEATINFSAIVLEFLRERVANFTEGVNFTEVEVVWQASETSNSTEFREPIDGMRIYFATIADIDDSIEVDPSWLIETTLKVDKVEFFTKLDENAYFLPVGIEGRIIDQEKFREVENQVETKPSTNSFLNTWVISCLGMVVFSVFVTTLLITKMTKNQAKPRRIQHLLAIEEGDNAFEISPAKANMHSLYTAGPSFSDHSTETVGTSNNNKRKISDTEMAELDDTYEVYSTNSQMSNSVSLEDESLVGLRLLGSEGHSSTSAPRYTVPTLDTYQSSAGLRLLGSEGEEDQQIGNNARMRKRQIEREIQQQGSQEGPSMEAILIATLSFNSDEDGGDQVDKTDTTKILSPKENAYSLKRSSRVEVATGNDETPSGKIIQTTSVLSRLSIFFHKKNNKQQSHQTVQMEEGHSKSAIHMQRNNQGQQQQQQQQQQDEYTGIFTEESVDTVPVLDVMSARNSISAADRDSFMSMSASHRALQKSPRVDKKRHSKDQRSHTSNDDDDNDDDFDSENEFSYTEDDSDDDNDSDDSDDDDDDNDESQDDDDDDSQAEDDDDDDDDESEEGHYRHHTSNHTVKTFHSSPIARRLSSARVPGLYSYQYQQREHNQEQIQQRQGSYDKAPARKSK